MPSFFRPALRALGLVAALSTLGVAPAAAALPAGSNAFADLAGARSIGDINGDGFDDIGNAAGRVAFGSANLATSPVTTFSVPAASQRDIAKLGDIDGDGYDDFSVGELANSSSAAGAYVIYGAPGTTGIPVTQGGRVGLIRAGASANGPQIRGIGDFNGDGVDDIAVWRQRGNNADPNLRAGWTIILGGARITSLDAQVASGRTLMLDGNTACKIVWVLAIIPVYTCGENSGDLRPAGDVNGDGKDDVITQTVVNPSTRGILFGRATGFGATAKITQAPAPAALFDGNPQEALPRAAGDVDGDGKDDLALGCVGFSGNVTIHRGRTVAAGSQFSLAAPAWTFDTSENCARPVAAGDLDGDGGDDLILQQMNDTVVSPGIGTMETGVITGLRTKPQGDGVTPLASLPQLPGIAQTWAQDPYGFGESIRSGAGDMNGDGLADVIVDDEQGRAVIATAGADRLAPEVAFRYSTITPGERVYAVGVLHSGFTPGAANAAQLSVVLDSPATVRFTVKRAGTTVGSFDRALPALKSETAWDGRVGGAVLANGDYTLEVTPRDAAGNAGATRSTAFTVGGGGPTGPVPATVDLKLNLLGPNGELVGGELYWVGSCPDALSGPAHLGNTSTSLPAGERFGGDRCELGIAGDWNATGVEGCDWTYTYVINGVARPSQAEFHRVVFELKDGANTVTATVQCAGGRVIAAERPGKFDSPRWLKYGAAKMQSATTALLTPAAANQTGALVWPDAFDPNDTALNFNVTMSGGNNTAEGIALAFIPATTTLPSTGGPLGVGGGTLGIGGLPFTAVTLDSFRQPSDPAAAFVGIATGSSGNSLTYVQTADPGIRLRTAGIAVSVRYKNGELSIWTKGVKRLARTVTLPSRAYLAISAATNATAWQQHAVANFTATGI